MLDEDELALTKAGALVINTARGPRVKERALIAARERGHPGGAGLDVVEEERKDPVKNRTVAEICESATHYLDSC